MLSEREIVELLSIGKGKELEELFAAAYRRKVELCGKGVAVRGLVEAGNVCAKDCLYCGIRKSNSCVKRYQLTADEIVTAAKESRSLGYKSLVIQSGEIESESHTRFIEEVLLRLKSLELGITLSLGEQTEEVYARWREAGATRYLLRIETSNPELYAKIHPKECDFKRRVECLKALRRTGYQVGTGVMIGLPNQTLADLARDIIFYREMDVDMIGMGPYIPAPNTPLASLHSTHHSLLTNHYSLTLGLKMIAATRLALGNVNIAAATALQALAEDGRERGIAAGANVIMPNVTDLKYRRGYQLYANKPGLDESASAFRSALDKRLEAIGEHILYDQLGDSRRFAERAKT